MGLPPRSPAYYHYVGDVKPYDEMLKMLREISSFHYIQDIRRWGS